MAHVADHADDLHEIVRFHHGDPSADRVFTRPVPARQRFVDDHDVRRVGIVAFGERTPPEEWNTHGAKVSGAQGLILDLRVVLERVGMTLDVVVQGCGRAAEGERQRRSGGDHSRKSGDPLDDLPDEGGCPSVFIVLGSRQVHSHDEQTLGPEAGIDREEPHQALREQSRGAQQQQRERHLGDHDPSSESPALMPLGDRPSGILER